jgi:hypothetical protein
VVGRAKRPRVVLNTKILNEKKPGLTGFSFPAVIKFLLAFRVEYFFQSNGVIYLPFLNFAHMCCD